MNISTSERKSVLRKVAATVSGSSVTNATSLPDAVFEVLRYDRTLVRSTNIAGQSATTFTSGTSGIFFVDQLPYGTYYLHETTVPGSATGEDRWFTLTVNANGVGYGEATSTPSHAVVADSTAP